LGFYLFQFNWQFNWLKYLRNVGYMANPAKKHFPMDLERVA
jgi:hypothetical protein